jgi:hypothetical protein
MRWIGRGLLRVAAASVLAACASHAPVGPPTATTSTTGSAPATGAAASNTETSAVPKGYRRVVKKGTEYFCRTEAVTGSHTLRNEVCLTKDELDAELNHRVTAGLNSPASSQGGARDLMPSR